MKPKGWKGESMRHGMSARGVETRSKELNKLVKQRKTLEQKRKKLQTQLAIEIKQLFEKEIPEIKGHIRVSYHDKDEFDIILTPPIQTLKFDTGELPDFREIVEDVDEDRISDGIGEIVADVVEDVLIDIMGAEEFDKKQEAIEDQYGYYAYLEEFYPTEAEELRNKATDVFWEDYVPSDIVYEVYGSRLNTAATKRLGLKTLLLEPVTGGHFDDELEIESVEGLFKINDIPKVIKELKTTSKTMGGFK